MRRFVAILTLLIAGPAGLGCDEVRLREGGNQALPYQSAALRILVSPKGIEEMFAVSQPEGFALDAEATVLISDDDLSVTIGPLAQHVPVAGRSATPGRDAVDLLTSFRDASVLVPMRIRDDLEVRICRFEIFAPQIDIHANLALIEDPERGRTLDIVDAPQIENAPFELNAVGPCELPDHPALADDSLPNVLSTFVLESFASSAREAFRTPPADIIGLIEEAVELRRVSIFENRRGTMLVAGRQAQQSLTLTEGGLEATLDVAADGRRASCAPPLAVDAQAQTSVGEIAPSVVSSHGADLALGLSEALLDRFAQAATRAGFACRGLEDPRRAENNADAIPLDDAMLEELGLSRAPLGAWVRIALSPGTLPVVRTRPDHSDLLVRWEDLQLEVYAEMYGVPVRVVSVTTSFSMSLRPQSQSVGQVRLNMETIDVERSEVESELLATPPDAGDVERWTRRMLLLQFAEQLTFPLPVQQGAALRVVATQVRSNDLVLFLRFE